MKLAVIVLAAGASKRFGKPNKLMQDFNGKPLVRNVLDLAASFPFCRHVAVCGEATEPIARDAGFVTVLNTEPERGQSLSMKLGVARCSDCDGALFMTGDQPFVTPETIRRLIAEFEAHPDCIIGCSVEGRFCIPSVFPSLVFPELLSQEGDVGGREVMRAHKDSVRLLPIDPKEHFDIDTPQDLSRAEGLLPK